MKTFIPLLFCSFLLVVSCHNEGEKLEKENGSTDFEEQKSTPQPDVNQEKKTEEKEDKSPQTNTLNEIGLVDIQTIDPSFLVELKYATTDNFTKKKLYFVLEKAYLQKDVAQKLKKAQDYLKQLHPNYSLLIYDAARPVDVQQRMWDALDSIPVNERTKFVSNPKNHSIHNYGAAIDLTIVDENKVPLDMGAGYDDIRTIAYPRMEEHFLATGALLPLHIQNRRLLRKVMSHAGFKNIATEWWHFNACDRNTAKAKYTVFLKEPEIQ